MLWSCAAALLGFALLGVRWCEINSRFDVGMVRRDAGAPDDDHGSNRSWYPRWNIPSILMLAGIALLLFAVSDVSMPARAHDHSRPHLDGWYKGLNSEKGPCCDGSDHSYVADVNWESKAGRYRVRLDGEWHDVPPEAVLQGPNLDGRTLVWPVKAWGGVNIRCFMPGSMT